MNWNKIKFYPLVLAVVCLVLLAFTLPNVLFNLTLPKQYPVTYTDSQGRKGTVVRLAPHKVADAVEGEKVKACIFFTAKGQAFIWDWMGECEGDTCDVVWKENGEWHGKLNGPIGSGALTGYQDIEDTDGIPVLLENQ